MFIFLFLSAVGANEFVSPIQSKSAGILFQPYGYVLNKVDDWSIVTTFNMNLLWNKIVSLRNLQYTITQCLDKSEFFNDNHLIYNTLMSQELDQLETTLRNLEDSTGTMKKRHRNKHAIIRFGFKVLKFLYGTPDADDYDDYNGKFDELYKNQHKQEELNKVNIRAEKDIINVLNATTFKTNANFDNISHSVDTILLLLKQEDKQIVSLRIRSEVENLFSYFTNLVSF